MKKVPIFIASSIREFDREREQFSEYLDMLNDVHEADGVEIEWKRPETMSHALRKGGSQLPYNKRITQSRFFVLIVGEKLGKHTEAEFNLALEQFNKTGAPVILPYFLNRRADMDVLRFLERLRKELDIGEQYVDTYDNFDQILNSLHIELIRYGAFIGEDAELSDRETAAQKGLDGIRELIAEQRDKIAQLKAQPIAPQIIAEINAAYEEIYRLVKAYKIDADALLDYMDFLWEERLYDTGIKLGHWLEKLYALDNPDMGVWARLKRALGDCYDDSNQKERKTTGERYYREALDIYKRLSEIKSALYEPCVAQTCNNLAMLLKSVNKTEEAERLYGKALEIRRRLAKDNPAVYEIDVAKTCNNLAELLRATNRLEEAERHYWESLEIRRRLVEANPSVYEPYVANICNNLGILLSSTNRMKDAEKYYLEALEIRRRYAAVNPSTYEPLLAQTCFNFGKFERKRGDRDAAKSYFEKSLSLYEKFPYYDEDAQRIRDELAKL